MIRYERPFWILAVSLAALAGFVDAIGFMMLGGLFVSFMSGNSTRMAVSLVAGTHVAAIAGALIASFVAGVVGGALVSARAGEARKAAVLVFVAMLLACAALADGRLPMPLPALLLAAAMGAENGVFQRDGEVSIGVTYMTGTLVKLGQRLALALLGGPRWTWVPYLLLWTGLIAGATAGAFLFAWWGASCLWIAAATAAALALLATRLAKTPLA